MKVLLDMNIPLKYAAMLTKRGIEVLRWPEVGAPNAEDAEIMAYARENDYIVLTFDLDFSTILSVTHDLKPSVVQIRASVQQAERVINIEPINSVIDMRISFAHTLIGLPLTVFTIGGILGGVIKGGWFA